MDKYVYVINKKPKLTEPLDLEEPTTSQVSEKELKPISEQEGSSSEEELEDVNLMEVVQLEEPNRKQNQKCKKKIYEQNFSEDWSKTFEWVENINNKAHCKACQKTIMGDSFHLKRHEKTTSHTNKVKALKGTPSVKNVLMNDEKLSLSRKIQNAEFKLCAFFCEKNLPFLLMDDLLPAMADIFSDSLIAKSVKMKKDKAAQIVVNRLGPTEQENIVRILKGKDRYFSLILDETTDVSTSKSLVVLARFWDDDKMEVYDCFLDLIEVRTCTAQALFDAVKVLLDQSSIPYENLAGFGADNANVMMGDRNGVKALLKTLNPYIFVLGCSCHSLHLCASHASALLPNTVELFMRDVYLHFAHSTQRINDLQEFQTFWGEKSTRILYLSSTRWLSRYAVVKRVLEHWNSLTLYFQHRILEDKSPTVQSLLNAFRNPVFKLYLSFLSYVLQLVTQVNIVLQSEQPKLPELLGTMTTLYKTILKCYIKREILESNVDIDSIIISNPHNYQGLDQLYLGACFDVIAKSGKVPPADMHNVKLRCLDFLVELSRQIKSRFDFGDEYLKFAANFTPANATSGQIMSIAEWSNLFPYLKLDLEAVNIEWQMLSELDSVKTWSQNNVTTFWKKVNRCTNGLGKPMFPNLMQLAKILLSLPHSSAAAERVFSQLSLMKTKLRNRLGISTCSSILHVKQSVKLAGTIRKWTPKNIMTKNVMSERDLESILEEETDF